MPETLMAEFDSEVVCTCPTPPSRLLPPCHRHPTRWWVGLTFLPRGLTYPSSLGCPHQADMKNSVKDRMNAQCSCAGHFIEANLKATGYAGPSLPATLAYP